MRYYCAVELRHMRYFLAVAEELHFGRAAEKLRIAQPPLSQQIQRLEGELGVKLFERTKRRVELTAAGKSFLKEARQTLEQAEQAVRAAQRASRGEIGELAVGFVGSATYHILPLVLRSFRSRFPNVEISLHEDSPAEQVRQLRMGGIHVGFFRSQFEDEALVSEVVLQEPMVVALPEAHELSGQPRVSLNRLAGEPFILFPRKIGPGFHDLIVSLCQRAGFSPRVAQEANDMQTIVSLVAAGLGVALVPASCQNFRRVGVVYKAIRDEGAKATMAVAWRRDDKSPVLDAFLNVVREVARQNSEP
jgi:DNA-binding transcriptional LysR family regulator